VLVCHEASLKRWHLPSATSPDPVGDNVRTGRSSHRMRRSDAARSRGLGASAAAMVLGLGPGAAVPFIAAARLGDEVSDRFLFALSVSVFLINSLALTIEIETVARVARPRESLAPVHRVVRTFAYRMTMRYGSPAAMVLVGVVLAVSGYSRELLFTSVLLALSALVASVTASSSGVLIAYRKTFWPILSQGFRSVLFLAAVLLAPDAGLIFFAVAFLCGEVVRAALLPLVVSRLAVDVGEKSPAHTDQARRPSVETRRDSGVGWQAAAVATSQVNPVVDRAFLAPLSVGSITAYEIADKISFSVYQLVYNMVILRRVGSWSAKFASIGVSARNWLVRELLRVAIAGVVLALVATLFIFAMMRFDFVSSEWRQGVEWSLVVVWSIPGSLLTASLFRVFAITEHSRLLLACIPIWVTLNAGANMVFLRIAGPVGIAYASVVTKTIFGVVLLLILDRRLRAARRT